MATLANAGSFAINVAISSGTRSLISNYMRIPKNQALVFNGVDMLASGISCYLYDHHNKTSQEEDATTIYKIIRARFISVISSYLITSYAIGTIHPGTALMLNVAALILGVVFKSFEGNLYLANALIIT